MSRLVVFTNTWGSGEIRGRQIARAAKTVGVDAVIDPTEVYSDDVVVSIKVIPREEVFNAVRAFYIDVIDSVGTFHALDRYTSMKAIAIGRLAYKYISDKYGEDRVVLIPEHNCNFERNIRVTNWPIKTAGYMGEEECFHIDHEELGHELKKIGVDFKFCCKYRNRQDVIDFYSDLDLQITFRIDNKHVSVPAELKNPLKLNNAGSFGIPSISYPEANYVDEWDGCFWPAMSLGEIVNTVERINKDKTMYRVMQSAALGRAEFYHIERILPLYLELLK